MHSSTKTKHEVQRRLLLDVIVRKSAPIFKLLTSKDKALLVRRNALLVLNLRLHVIDCVAGFDVQRDRLASQGLHEDLHATTEAKHEVQCRLLLDVIVRKSAPIF